MSREHEAIVRAIARAIADMDLIDIVDYEGPWSEVTPGCGRSDGCIFCKSTSATTKGGHLDGCLWVRARLLAYGVTQ